MPASVPGVTLRVGGGAACATAVAADLLPEAGDSGTVEAGLGL
jgi:hypothetical protein